VFQWILVPPVFQWILVPQSSKYKLVKRDAGGYCTTLKATLYATERCRKPNPTLTAVYGQIRIVTPEAEPKYAIPLHT
jgi:hypothetical protein